jgi:hypothetical protein|tara:strand:+ start:155 stop:322 length:168 start_codon:yes stop_codon:yes gene_type:complete
MPESDTSMSETDIQNNNINSSIKQIEQDEADAPATPTRSSMSENPVATGGNPDYS